jgi:hypothetical protein
MAIKKRPDSFWNRIIEALDGNSSGVPDFSNPVIIENDVRLIEYTGTPTNTTPNAAAVPGLQASGKSFGDHTHRSCGGLAAISDVVTVANDASITTILSVDVVGSLLQTGTTIEIEANGNVTTESGASLAGDWVVVFGSSVLTGAAQLTFSPSFDALLAAVGWKLHAIIQVRTVGGGSATTSGAVMINGDLMGAFGANLVQCMNVSALAAPVAVNTIAAARTVALTFKWGTASAGNSLSVENCVIKLTNL